jgi:hypothetical protein
MVGAVMVAVVDVPQLGILHSKDANMIVNCVRRDTNMECDVCAVVMREKNGLEK